ncbi:hypothetical protein Sjap_005917 [Stephania japonica]|uniref:Uncharacterized protein n=1 Tax=Stephania japonica TaxID=461633 RepID=A0AAP0K6L1_9MAGN
MHNAYVRILTKNETQKEKKGFFLIFQPNKKEFVGYLWKKLNLANQGIKVQLTRVGKMFINNANNNNNNNNDNNNNNNNNANDEEKIITDF